MTTAYGYIRFSSIKQEEGDSLRRQTEKINAYVAKHNLRLDPRSFKDLGVSAFKSKNATEGQLRTFLNGIDEGKIERGSYLLVEEFDRLSRAPVMTAFSLLQRIMEAGITVVTLMDERRYSTEGLNSDWTPLILALNAMSSAHGENTKKSIRVKESWEGRRKAAEKGGPKLTGMCPAWLKLSDDRMTFHEIEEKVKVVQEIFELALLYGTPTIAKKLNAKKTPLLKGGNSRTAGEVHVGWTNSHVAHVLKNEAVIGTYTPKKVDLPPVPDYYPRIIEPAIFQKVKTETAKRTDKGGRKGTGVANLFSGMSVCGKCGSKMRIVSGIFPNIYVQCIRAHAADACTAPRVPYVPVEKAILFRIINVQHWRVYDFGKMQHVDPRPAIEGEIAMKHETINRLLDSIADASTGAPKALTQRVVKLEAEIEELQERLKNTAPPVNRDESYREAIELKERQEELQGDPSKIEELTELRQRLQNAIRGIISEVSFTPGKTEVKVTFTSGTERDLDYSSYLPKQGFQPGNRNGKRA